jgi:hypothetical protein
MAQPARMPPELDEPPVYDPGAIDQAYRLHRARRHARLERRRESRRAGLRFWLVLGALTAGCLVLAVSIWLEIENLFGV